MKNPMPLAAYLLALVLLTACGGGGGGGSGNDAAETPAAVEPTTGPDAPDDEPAEPSPVPAPSPEPIVTADRPLDDGRGLALLRRVPSDYADGVSALAGPLRPGPREVSNAVAAQEESVPSAAGLTDTFWQWGQFLDHDIALTPEADPEEPADVSVPAGDPFMDPFGTGLVRIPFHRAAFVADSVPREQVNDLTCFIDGSNVYGSTAERALALRALDGTGRLRTSEGDLLPRNIEGLPNAGGTEAALFVAGDIRANEQVALLAIHTLFLREHNRLADGIRSRAPDLTGEDVYQAARRIVIAELQVITYEEFLPRLLGPGALPPYAGYDASVDPGLSNVFSTAAYRLGHSMLSPVILRLDAAGDEIEEGHLALREAFFHPELIAEEDDIDPILRGLAAQVMQEVDVRVVDDVRNFLFGPPGAGGLDLAALNLQRGRDHGLPSLNDTRTGLGLPRHESFDDVTGNPEVRSRLSSAYASVDEIDLWIGGLAEDQVPGALVGETFFRVLRDQFLRLRDGDPWWFERTLAGDELDAVRAIRLSDVIRRNTGIRGELPDDVFQRPNGGVEPSPAALRAPPLDDRRRRRIEDGMGR